MEMTATQMISLAGNCVLAPVVVILYRHNQELHKKLFDIAVAHGELFKKLALKSVGSGGGDSD